ncbi:ABC transporter [Acidobacteria bacterium AH-259-A15]|nr:ABC transporter [Acidobacteria bacterium AH-259-A15]
MTDWKWNGSRWWKFDFHAHTPPSDDYGKGPDQATLKQRTPREWLLDYMRMGIDCVAITDHNTGEWVDQLKTALRELESEQPDGFRPIHVFPGVEISVTGGVHILAILGCDKTTSDIDSLLGAAGFLGTKGLSNAVTHKSFVEVVDAVASAGGISIPAHVDKDNGLFEVTGTTLQQVLDREDIFAMELMNPAYQKPQSYIDTSLCWTEILGSDAHHPSGNVGQRYPGSHFTWVKMGSPSIEGLRLALLDGSLSVRRSDQETGNPNEHAPLVLESVKTSRARYLGRSQPFAIGLNPWLNAIIGGRGTGKSTVVEFLRIVLRRKDELPNDLKEEFKKYGRVYPDREDGGLLTNDAAIRAIYRKNGSRFRVQWNPAADLEPIEQEVDGEWRRAEGDIRLRFPVRIYSQKQIFQLAKTPLALLRVVDEAPEVDRHSWAERWKEEEGRFLSLRARAREIEAGLAEEPRLRGELDDVKRKLAIFEQAGHADVLKAFQKRSRQQREVEAWEEGWTGAGEQLRKVATEIVPDLLDETTFDPDSAVDTELREHAAKVHDRLDEIRKALETLASQADEVFTEWRKSRDESSWKKNVDAAARAYQELRDNLAREGAGDPAAYGEFVQRRQGIEQRLKGLDERKTQVEELKEQADAHLQRLVEIRRELTESRRKFLNDVLSENLYVRIQVVPYGARETVEGEFRRCLQREDGGFEKDIGSPGGEGLLGELYRNSNGTENIEQNLANIKDKVRNIALDQYDAGTVADRRFETHIRRLPPEAIDRLDLWFPEDSLDVQYSTTGDGQHFRSIQEGSPGQKTAALLAFLLSYGEEPLILDQPEDDLDNHLIYDLIVTQLREVKRYRQVIVVTHNANIVVNGDAELVVALAARGGETQKECEGSLQEKPVRETICAVMEGGRKAFKDRYRRIVLEGRHV